MRIRRSVSRFFLLSVFPAISLADAAYFGYHAVWGERGMNALASVQANLDIEKQRLSEVEGARQRLEHRIALMRDRNADPDLVEELARSQLMIGAPGQVAVPRSAH